MSDPNIIDPEYNEFLKVFDGCWPTNYEFFLAACNWQKQKQEKVQDEPIIWIAEGHLREVSNGNILNCYCSPDKDRFAEVPLYTKESE